MVPGASCVICSAPHETRNCVFTTLARDLGLPRVDSKATMDKVAKEFSEKTPKAMDWLAKYSKSEKKP